jgi:hypothetical protein
MTSRANLLCLTAIGLPNEYEHQPTSCGQNFNACEPGFANRLLYHSRLLHFACHLSHSYDFYHIYYDPALLSGAIVTIAAFAFSRTCSCKLRSASATFSVSTSLRSGSIPVAELFRASSIITGLVEALPLRQ